MGKIETAGDFSASDIGVIDGLLDRLRLIAFWIDVSPDGEFRYRRFNRFYVEYVGKALKSVEGKTPHEAFPERLAETVTRNYAVCRDTGAPYVYEELLDLSQGPKWWKTTLSPIRNEAGAVVSIVGTAEDITSFKERDFEANVVRARTDAMIRRFDAFARHAVEDVRGPCVSMIALLNVVRQGFVDHGDGKVHLIEEVERIATDLRRRIDSMVPRAHLTAAAHAADETQTDLGHLCADLCALIDPDKKLDILFPLMRLEVNRSLLQSILRSALENARAHAIERIEIEASDYGDGVVHISVFDDGIGPEDHLRANGDLLLSGLSAGGDGPTVTDPLAHAAELVSAAGGWLEAGLSDDGASVEVSFSLPGRITHVERETLVSNSEVDTEPGVAQRLRIVG